MKNCFLIFSLSVILSSPALASVKTLRCEVSRYGQFDTPPPPLPMDGSPAPGLPPKSEPTDEGNFVENLIVRLDGPIVTAVMPKTQDDVEIRFFTFKKTADQQRLYGKYQLFVKLTGKKDGIPRYDYENRSQLAITFGDSGDSAIQAITTLHSPGGAEQIMGVSCTKLN